MGASADIVVGVDGSAGATTAPAIDVLERRPRAAELGVVGTGHLDHHGQHLLCHSVARDIAHRAVLGPSADIVARRWYRLRRVWWPIAATTSLAVLLAHGGDAAAGARVRVLLAAVATAQIGASNAPRVRNAMKVALGVLTLLSGAGFLPFVVKEARSGTALAAIVAVVAGAGLIATGSGGIVRPQRRWAPGGGDRRDRGAVGVGRAMQRRARSSGEPRVGYERAPGSDAPVASSPVVEVGGFPRPLSPQQAPSLVRRGPHR